MADQGKVVITITATEAIVRGNLVDAAGGLTASRAIGVAVDSAASGELVPVQISGTALVKAGGAISAKGKTLKSDANGDAVEATNDATDTYMICAIALETAADGELFDCKIV